MRCGKARLGTRCGCDQHTKEPAGGAERPLSPPCAPPPPPPPAPVRAPRDTCPPLPGSQKTSRGRGRGSGPPRLPPPGPGASGRALASPSLLPRGLEMAIATGACSEGAVVAVAHPAVGKGRRCLHPGPRQPPSVSEEPLPGVEVAPLGSPLWSSSAKCCAHSRRLVDTSRAHSDGEKPRDPASRADPVGRAGVGRVLPGSLAARLARPCDPSTGPTVSPGARG